MNAAANGRAQERHRLRLPILKCRGLRPISSGHLAVIAQAEPI